MAKNGEPVVLELASLPREQTGPFLLLGLDKTADKEKMEARWADRVRWARKTSARFRRRATPASPIPRGWQGTT